MKRVAAFLAVTAVLLWVVPAGLKPGHTWQVRDYFRACVWAWRRPRAVVADVLATWGTRL